MYQGSIRRSVSRSAYHVQMAGAPEQEFAVPLFGRVPAKSPGKNIKSGIQFVCQTVEGVTDLFIGET